MKTIQCFRLLLLLAMIPFTAPAQYWGERALEKGFEQSDFFFTPSYLMPFGIGSFKGTTAGLLADPLQEIIVNPSRLGLDSARNAWLYSDFRGAKNVQEEDNWVVPCYANLYDASYASSMYYRPYPRVFLETRRELEPVFSGGAIFRPLPEIAPTFFVGATYQYILQDSKYYTVPQDIYKTAAGYDFNGRSVAASESIPIVDKYSGKNDMHQVGHFGSAFIRYSPLEGLDFGAKLNRTSFHRDGSYGSSDYWDYSSSSTSLYSDIELRAQSYAAWDLAGGATYHVTDRVAFGVTAGHLWGNAVQALRTADSSYHSYVSTSSNSYYNRSSNGLYQWNHIGKTTYYGADLVDHISPAVTLNFYYRRQKADIDIGLASGVLDTSFSTYSYTYETTSYQSTSRSYLQDVRTGNGTQSTASDKFMGSIRWQIDERVSLAIGAQVEWYSMDIKTDESVAMANRYVYTSNNPYDSRSTQEESKILRWTFASERTSVQIPIIVTIRASRALELMVGINRDMSSWKIDDRTLALFDYRFTNENGTTTRKERFGEAYTLPTEKVSDIRTTLLAGLAVSPSDKLNLRLLMVPNFREGFDGQELDQLQVWLGMTVTP